MLDATELLCEALDRVGISRTELARRLGVVPSEITQRLRGRNLTVKSLAATLDALDHTLAIEAKPRDTATMSFTPVEWFDASALGNVHLLRRESHTSYDVPPIQLPLDTIGVAG